MKGASSRLDVELVQRGLARSRGQARDLVDAGGVQVNGRPATKAAQPIRTGDTVLVSDAQARFVGRGAGKLEAALDHFAIEVAGKRCADIGASTGGFTQVLLERNARSVAAVDAGREQMDPGLLNHPAVTDHSGTSVRGLLAAQIGGPVELLVADLSFISLTCVASDLRGLLAPRGRLVALIKPQFEVGRAALNRAGVVRRWQDRADAVSRVLQSFAAAGLIPQALLASPVTGGVGSRVGNQEFFVLAQLLPEPVGSTWEALHQRARALAQEAR